jgi:hypothetical protein
MMNVLEITVALIILLIITLIILRRQKKCSSCSSKETILDKPKAPEPVKPQQETKPADNPVVNVEPSTANAQITDTKVVAPSAIAQAAYPTENNSVLPQDSILKRHYLTHLCSMIEALAPPRPTESVLCRHYDMMIAAKIVQCLNDEKAAEQLIFDYEKIGA